MKEKHTFITLFHKLHNRSRYIEYCLRYRGFINRADLITKFDISEASATRAIKEYIELSGFKNAKFNPENKSNEITNEFTPLFDISEKEAIEWLQLENLPSNQSPLVYSFQRLNLPDEMEFAPIIQAITQQKCARIKYLSLSSGEKERIIVPHSIFNDGLRIYIRTYDRNRDKFIDLTASRIVEANLLEDRPKSHETGTKDHEWDNLIELTLIPHPNLSKIAQEVIQYEYKMVRGKLRITVRQSTANYFLRVWNVDCSPCASLNPEVHHLRLENIEMLSEVLSPIAPGYKNPY